MTQRDTNPYRYSDSNKRYMTYDWYMKTRFGGKTAKVSLDAGFTCPNIDGTRGCGGCVYCSGGSRSAIGDTLEAQYQNGVEIARRKWKPIGFIPYLQANTNTYAPVDVLKKIYSRAASMDGAVMLDIATRADCLSYEVIDLLADTARSIPLTVELGLQTSSDTTAKIINRCHTFAEFTDGYGRLKKAADKVNHEFNDSFSRFQIGVHLINGLPGEDHADMIKSALDVASLRPDMVKIHLLHVLRGTKLAEMFEDGSYIPMSMRDYVNTVCDQLELLPSDTIIGRVTGDGMADSLIAPMWSRRKTEVANEIDKELYRRQTYEGFRYNDHSCQ